MKRVGNVLIVGGGIAGLSLAVGLARVGIAAEIVEKDKDWRVYGAGISLTGPTLRAFHALGMLEAIETHGYCHSGLKLCDGETGAILQEIVTPPIDSGRVPGGGGIMRPVLQTLLADAVRAANGRVRLGITVESLVQDEAGVDVRFTDGTSGFYDVVVGADGLNSAMRAMLFPNAPGPVFTGQAVWRLTVPRVAAIDSTYIFFRGSEKIGINPASQDEMYLFMVQSAPGNLRIDPASHHVLLRELMAGFGGVIADVRETLGPDARSLYRPMESVLVPAPWFLGRVILIGDAVHASTPHLASGAGIAVEDAVVLSALLGEVAEPDVAFRHFMERRYQRCRSVVENSLRIGEMEMSGAPAEQTAALVADSLRALHAPV